MAVTQPNSQVEHTIHLLPPDTTVTEQNKITADLHETRSAFTYSADAAHAVAYVGTLRSKVVVWSGERWRDDIFAWFKDKGINTEARQLDGGPVLRSGHDFGGSQRARTAPNNNIEHTIHLFPQDKITLAEMHQVTAELYTTKSAFSYSADAAHALVYHGTANSKVVVWSGERWTADIYAWLKNRGISFASERIDSPDGDSFIFTHWPTDYPTITQGYNKNPDYYGGFGLTGHEGIDIRAPMGATIYAVADGIVQTTRESPNNHPYGTAVYIQHRDGYRTVYAHLESIDPEIFPSAQVDGGQEIGKADSTGNVWPPDDPTAASHLHLTLYHAGATARGETEQPNDIIDPVPYMSHLPEYQTAVSGQPAGPIWPIPQAPYITGWAYIPGLQTEGMLAKVISAKYINLRRQPNTDQSPIGQVNNGTIVKLAGESENNYYKVLVSDTDVVKPQRRTQLEIGMHNLNGAEWMLAQGMKGWALQTVALGSGSGKTINATRFSNAGIKLLVRLNYGYGSTGTIPKDDDPHYDTFVQSCIDTMKQSSGVWGYIIANETNNSNEFPGNHNGEGGEPITPKRYAKLYNLIWNQKPAGVRIGTQAVDPYFDPARILNLDSREYWKQILDNIVGADFLTVHPKTQDSNPDSIDSDRKFDANGPLHWQYYHMKSYQPLLDVVPPRFRSLPVIATEVNPQRHNDNRTLGWQTDKGEAWVAKAVQHFEAYNQTAVMPVTGVIFYRYSNDDWKLSDKPKILRAIKQVA